MSTAKKVACIGAAGDALDSVDDLCLNAGLSLQSFADVGSLRSALDHQFFDLAIISLDKAIKPDEFMDLCAELRRKIVLLPILFFGADIDVDLQVRAWKAGADDCFSFKKEQNLAASLMLTRVLALLTRYKTLRQVVKEAPGAANHRSNLALVPDKKLAYWKGQRLSISAIQYQFIEALYLEGGQPVSHEQLLQAAKIVVASNTLVAHIKSIRSAFKKIDQEFDAIKTERCFGYRWIN